MRKSTFFFTGLMLLASLIFIQCGQNELLGFEKGNAKHFNAHLTGDAEVQNPAVVTNATGQANFKLSKSGTELSYKVLVAGLDDVLFAHLHMAPAGSNGGVVVTLLPGPGISGPVNGILTEGTITASNLSGALAGLTIADLVDRIQLGRIYVNVHTANYPAGELRGQVD